MGEWKEYLIGDIIKLEYGKSLLDYRSGKGQFDVFGTNGKIGLTDKFLFDEPSVIVGRKGAYREVHYAKNPFFVIDTAFYTKNLIENLDTTFLYFWLKNIDINSMDSGSAIPSTSRDEVYELEISLPPLPEQKAIASVLSSLDDKIDLLHRQNATLEKMAETLFRQWFVEEAKEEWGVGNLGDLFTLQRGFDLPIQNRVKGSYPIYASSGESGFHIESKVKGPGVTTGRSGVLGNVFYIQENFWPLNTSLYIKEFKNSSPLHSYFVLKTIDLNSFNAGSAVPTLNRNHVHEFPIEIPPMSLVNQFDNFAGPLFIKIKSNKIQIQTLTAMRDNLLPKLMSGEVTLNF
jgi:type I restriction enzyme S subunit